MNVSSLDLTVYKDKLKELPVSRVQKRRLRRDLMASIDYLMAI